MQACLCECARILRFIILITFFSIKMRNKALMCVYIYKGGCVVQCECMFVSMDAHEGPFDALKIFAKLFESG